MNRSAYIVIQASSITKKFIKNEKKISVLYSKNNKLFNFAFNFKSFRKQLNGN